MIGNTMLRRWPSQNGALVRVGKGTTTKPNPPISFARRAPILVRFGRVFHKQDHLVFGLVSRHGNDW